MLGADGAPAADPAARLQQIAELREEAPPALQLALRLEADAPDLALAPSELVWTADTGATLLVHLPSLRTAAGSPAAGWPAGLAAASPAVAVSADGSTRVLGATQVARYALGQAAPLPGHATLRRRRVRYRNLCPWRNETAADKLDPTPAGWLDVDPAYGLFALAPSEPPPTWPGPPADPALRPAACTVDYQQGYSAHVGALPAAREPELSARLETPTRLVSRSGALHATAPASWHGIPRYPSLTEALAAAGAENPPLEREVVEFQDSATYPEQPAWPAGPGALVLQAAERQRPVLVLSGWDPLPAGHYAELVLHGLALGGGALLLPPSEKTVVRFCTLTGPEAVLTFADLAGAGGGEAEVEVSRSVLAGLVLAGPGTLTVDDSVIDPGDGVAGGAALEAPAGRCRLERVTALGSVTALVLDASEAIATGPVQVLDRFHGCVRYSAVPAGSVLPRRHRVVEDAALDFVSLGREDPAHARLSERCDPAVRQGAEDGSEMGVFHGVRAAQREAALARRIAEFTPAGLETGFLRLD